VLDIMTIDLYQLMIGTGLAILKVIGCLIMLLGWFFYLETKLRRYRNLDGRLRGLPLISPGAWGEPDLAPPSTSAAARSEVAQLEELWTMPPHRASTGTD
jgi:hypothetical protein